MAQNHQQIAHRWAQRNPDLKAKGFNVIAEGLTIFSYGHHFPIARWFQPIGKGSPDWAIWFNARGYSTSTAKHKNFASHAIPSGVQVFTLPDDLWIPDLDGCGFNAKQMRDAIKHYLAKAVAWYEAQALESFQNAARARSNAPWLTRQAESYLAGAERLSRLYGQTYKPADMSDLKARADKRAADMKREAAKAAKTREIAQRAAYAEARAKFLAGEPARYFLDLDGTALVRRSPVTGEFLETSQGASVPWEHAVKAFRAIRACRERGTSWKRNGETIRVGHFQIDEIDASGNMKAGCHLFSWANMSALAIAEGVF